MPPDGPGRLDIAVCDRHGLRYNRAVERGCAMCRREAGSAAAQAVPTSRPASPAPPPAARPPARVAPAPQGDPRATPVEPSASRLAPGTSPSTPAPTGQGRTADIVVCDKHGLRYNRAVESGCVRCRRESGVAPAATSGASRAATPRPAGPPDAPASTGVQLLLAFLLVGGAGALFWTAHKAVLESFAGGVLATVGKQSAEAAAAPAARKQFEQVDPFDPSTIPTPEFDPHGYGPAEEQKQMHEFFQQMKEDEAKERGNAPPAAPQ